MSKSVAVQIGVILSTVNFPLLKAGDWKMLWHGNECGKNKIMRISRQPIPVKIMIDHKQLENMKSSKYFSSLLTNDGRCTCEIK